jgi:glycerol-3-phosphate acyltransferase PlsY
MIYAAILFGYLFGSIPFALVVGKVFFKKDIRQFGSGNLGGTNAGRVLGAPAGIAVSILDGLKGFIAISLTVWLIPGDVNAAVLTGFAAAIGHCYPLFANFRGGKAVSTTFGYLLGMAVYFSSPWAIVWTFVFPLCLFFLILKLTKFVSFSSMISVTVAAILMFIVQDRLIVSVFAALIAVLVIYRHRSNIKRLIAGNENKVKWL